MVDPMGLKGSWEGIVEYKDLKATHRTQTISANAQWFEDHSPIKPLFRKEVVKVLQQMLFVLQCWEVMSIHLQL